MDGQTTATRETVLAAAKRLYGTVPEHPWADSPCHAVLRRSDNGKWYGAILRVPRERVELSGQGTVDLLNLKADPLLIGSLLLSDGFLPAYHMNKQHWVSVRLDGVVSLDEVLSLLAVSCRLTAPRERKSL